MDGISPDGDPLGAVIAFAKTFPEAIYVKCFLLSEDLQDIELTDVVQSIFLC